MIIGLSICGSLFSQNKWQDPLISQGEKEASKDKSNVDFISFWLKAGEEYLIPEGEVWEFSKDELGASTSENKKTFVIRAQEDGECFVLTIVESAYVGFNFENSIYGDNCMFNEQKSISYSLLTNTLYVRESMIIYPRYSFQIKRIKMKK